MSTPAVPPRGPQCPRCGAPHGPDQEYCLECGQRLRPASGVFGRLAAVYLVCLFGFIIWAGLVISLLFFAGVKPPLAAG